MSPYRLQRCNGPFQPAWSQAGKFPTRPVTLIQPYTPGGSTDIEARLYHQRLTEALGQTVLLDYKPGAGSAVGTAWVSKQPPDGYTIISVTPALTIIPAFYPDKPPYDAANDLSPITQMTKRSAFLLVPPSLGIKNFEVTNWYGVAAPAGTPPDIVNKLNGEINRILELKDVIARFDELGTRRNPMSPADFAAFQRAELAKYKEVVTRAGVRME